MLIVGLDWKSRKQGSIPHFAIFFLCSLGNHKLSSGLKFILFFESLENNFLQRGII